MTDYSDMELEEIQRMKEEENKAYRKYARESNKWKKLLEAMRNGEPVSNKELIEQNDRMVDSMVAWVNFFSYGADIEKEPKEPKPKKSTKKKAEMI